MEAAERAFLRGRYFLLGQRGLVVDLRLLSRLFERGGLFEQGRPSSVFAVARNGRTPKAALCDARGHDGCVISPLASPRALVTATIASDMIVARPSPSACAVGGNPASSVSASMRPVRFLFGGRADFGRGQRGGGRLRGDRDVRRRGARPETARSTSRAEWPSTSPRRIPWRGSRPSWGSTGPSYVR